MIKFGREICGQLPVASQREWLVTNGLGGFASGTISGILTRRYHGLLIAALKPPLGRTLLVSKLDETIHFAGQDFFLSSNRWSTGVVYPEGYKLIQRFTLERSIPTWEYAINEIVLEKKIWMAPYENTTYIRYTYLQSGKAPLLMVLRTLVNPRDYHGMTHANQADEISVSTCSDGLKFQANRIPATCYIRSPAAQVQTEGTWERNFFLTSEAARGQSSIEDHFAIGSFQVDLQPGANFTLVISTQDQVDLDGEAALQNREAYDQHLIHLAQPINLTTTPAPAVLEQLILAADQFIVNRPTSTEPEGKSIIAGYPWFSDWGRDTMISLPGLTLATGRPETARRILVNYAAFVDQGMLPNRFPDQGELPEYNTVDATLWFFEAIRAYLTYTKDLSLVIQLFPILEDIINWHFRGTRYNIHCDPEDGLLYAGEAGSQLTWMDVRIDGWTVTPRIGKPVEVNALWFNALAVMADFEKILNRPGNRFQQAADKVRKNFTRFWNPANRSLYDVLEGPIGNDASFRPNQIFAVSLANSPLEKNYKRAIVDAVAHFLLTSHGLRSLSQNEAGYIGKYAGDRWQRDAAYHQGTVWGWLIGPFISAHLNVYHDPRAAWRFLQPLFDHLADHGLGSISEIFDGDAPFRPDGCIAQAWSVAEVLRTVVQIQTYL
jgi:predicted glycogen debranching enzyme